MALGKPPYLREGKAAPEVFRIQWSGEYTLFQTRNPTQASLAKVSTSTELLLASTI